jgi:hypothetical protein
MMVKEIAKRQRTCSPVHVKAKLRAKELSEPERAQQALLFVCDRMRGTPDFRETLLYHPDWLPVLPCSET